MQRKRAIPTKPRFDYVVDKAYKLLVELGISALPVSHETILEEYAGKIICMPLSEVNDMLVRNGQAPMQVTEGKTYKERANGPYIVIYNDITIKYPDRIRWTIMHEIGHILLGHLDEFEVTALNRGALSEEEYGVLEVEAHMFAAEVLAPTVILKSFSNITEEKIRTMCWLSSLASSKRYSSLTENDYHPATSYDHKILRNFSSFMRWDAADAVYQGAQRLIAYGSYDSWNLIDLSRKCKKCFSFTTDPQAKYCIYCGDSLLLDENESYERLLSGDDKALIAHPGRRRFSYEQVRKSADWEFTRMQQCPVCQNEQVPFYAEYCPVCGQQLQNQCLNENKAVPIRARFCPDCGGITSFHNAYKRHEEFQILLDKLPVSDDWLEYPYWDYVISKVWSKKELTSAMNESKAFIADDDTIHVISVGKRNAGILINMRDSLLALISQASGMKYDEMEVYAI